ncbi:MlrC C-terminal domain-containing protein [Sinorhizobium terangae]|uniref:MlrC C-terminal domain-containing protein n=1 Tax=Sinorhizobium terangae TaxID=110322 RepID=UPI001F3B1616|nr:MlrC C-terminal domain-containing protein [Sinorhizobium terangae]
MDGQLTTSMVRSADILGYKTNPHSDMAETGGKVLRTLVDLPLSKKRITRAFLKLPFLLQGRLSTNERPYDAIYERAEALVRAKPDLNDITLFNGHQYLDITESGQSVLVTYCGPDKSVAEKACREIGEMLLAARNEFVQDFPNPEAVFQEILSGTLGRPAILGDFGDRVLAGAPGASTEIISLALNRFPNLRGACVILDPPAVERCQRAGEGSSLNLTFGGRHTPNMEPVTARATVRQLLSGDFQNRGPYMKGVPALLGPTAHVSVGKLEILITSISPMVQDPAAYESFGISLAELDFAVAKSGSHFRLNFIAVGSPTIVRTDGLTSWDFRRFDYRRAKFVLPREEWPEKFAKNNTAADFLVKHVFVLGRTV